MAGPADAPDVLIPLGRRARRPAPAGRGKFLYLMNDFTVQEQLCNLRCSYCLNFENELKGGKPWVPMEKIDLEPDGFGWQRARQVLATMQAAADAPILRFSGGEVLALTGAPSAIREAAGQWHRVQVLTNATLLVGETLEVLSELDNLNLCCSVDGHTIELNKLRVKNPRWAQRIIDGTLAAMAAGIPVEVNMVVTQLNVGAIYDFARFLLEQPRTSDVKLMPFPVRGKVAGGDGMGATSEQCGSLRRLIREHQDFAEVLPPVAYLERLLRFYVDERRRDACRVPLSFVQSFDDGVIASCANCWSNKLGNVLDDVSLFGDMGEAPIHKLFLRNPPRHPFCRGCFTPFDVVNAYFSGECSLDDLARMDLYSSAPVRERLQRMRAAWMDGGSEALWERSERGTC